MTTPAPSEQRDSRVLLFSQRNLHAPLFQAMQYELEDLLVDMDDVDLLAPPLHDHAELSRATRRVLNGGLRRFGRPRHTPPGNRPSMRQMTVTAEHDLFFAVFHDGYQLSYLERLTGWRERSRRAVCLLMEVWTPAVARDRDYYTLLRDFDAVYAFTPEAGPALVAVGSPVPDFLPAGVDALQSRPGPHHPRRLIDVYSYGRTSATLHSQLLQQAQEEGLTYLYDTTSRGEVLNHREHRALLSNLMKRSTFFLGHRINDSPDRRERTGGEESLSTRYFEATAGGAVVLGSEPQTPSFRQCFDWPDAVIPLPYDSHDVAGVLRDLADQPDRLEAARAAGVAAGLLRHDWAYRWGRILSDSGLSPAPGLVRRQEQLAQAAAESVLTA